MIKDKIKTIEELEEIIKSLKNKGKKIVTCNGSFDIIHAGHVGFFEKAKRQGDVLVVGVNSDKSYKEYKHKEGPLITENARALIVASIESVDYVFLFDETTPNNWILKLKPDVHAIGASYTAECIEACAVKEVGGKLFLISNIGGLSTTKLIEKIIDRYGNKENKLSAQKAVFLDRDGTVNENLHGYVSKIEDFRLTNNAIPGLKKMKEMGYKLIIVTSQSGIARGFYTEDDMHKFNEHLINELKKEGIVIEEIYYCLHYPEGKIEKYRKVCDCRKPGPVLYEKAKKEHNIDMTKSFVIGDSTTDIMAGKKVGAKTILVKTGYGGNDCKYKVESDYIAEDLLDASKIIEKIEKEKN